MADNTTLNAGSGGVTVGDDDIAGIKYQRIKLIQGVDGTNDGDVAATNPLPVDIREIGGAAVAVGGGVEATAQRVTIASDSTGVISVDDGGAALTTDWAGTAPPIGAGLEATALRVTLATDSTGVVSVDDNGGNLSTDWAGTVPPIGAGVEATALRVTLATDSTGVVSVDDGGGTLTTDSLSDAVDDAAFTAAAGSGVPAMGFFSADTVDAGDAGVLAMDASRRLLVSIEADNVGIGGGTQYTEDAAAAANPVGSAQILVRQDTPGALVSLDGDNVARRGTDFGAAFSQIVDSSGNFVDTFGGGTQYVEGATDASITGTAMMFEGAADAIVAATGTAANGLDVDVTRVGGTVATDWSGTAQPIGAGVEATALRVTVATDSTGVLSIDDNAGSLTVDGTVTVTHPALGTGTEAGAQRVTIATDSTGVVSVDDNGAALTVDWAGTAPPIGAGLEATALRVTVATDSTGTLSVDDGGGALTVDGTVTETNSTAILADTANMDTNLGTVAGAVTGTEMQVDVVAALPAGTNAIGKLAANSGVDIGDVDVTDVVPGVAATSLGKAEDAVHGSADTGVYVLAVRDDAPAAHSGTDGDYESLHVSADGALWNTSTGASTGGLSIFRSLDLDETEEAVSTTACTVYGWFLANTTAATLYLKFYDATVATVVVGTTTPVLTFPIPGNSSDTVAANVMGGLGIGFATACTVAVTTGLADADTGAPGANAFVANIFYNN